MYDTIYVFEWHVPLMKVKKKKPNLLCCAIEDLTNVLTENFGILEASKFQTFGIKSPLLYFTVTP